MTTININHINSTPSFQPSSLFQYCWQKTKNLSSRLFGINNSESSLTPPPNSYNWKILTGLGVLATCTAIAVYESLSPQENEFSTTAPNLNQEILKTATYAIPIIGRKLLAISDNSSVDQIPDQTFHEGEEVSKNLGILDNLFNTTWSPELRMQTSSLDTKNLAESLKVSLNLFTIVGNFSFERQYFPKQILVRHPYLYAFSEDDKTLSSKYLSIFDVTNPSELKIKSTLDITVDSSTNNYNPYLFLKQNNLYVSTASSICNIDISSSTNPRIVKSYDFIPKDISGIQPKIDQGLLYTYRRTDDNSVIFQILNISDPYQFVLISNTSLSNIQNILSSRTLKCDTNLCYGIGNSVVDVSNPLNVRVVGYNPFLSSLSVVSGGFGYRINSTTNTIDTLDLRNISDIKIYQNTYSFNLPGMILGNLRMIDDSLGVFGINSNLLNPIVSISRVGISNPFSLITKSTSYVKSRFISDSLNYYQNNYFLLPTDPYRGSIITTPKGATLDLEGSVPIGSQGKYTVNITANANNKVIGWQPLNINILPAISVANITSDQVVKPNNLFTYSPGSLFSHFNNELISFSAKQ
ncbi:MAG: hypothetical protein ACOVOV_02320, partial [Dolichospermum sp.]